MSRDDAQGRRAQERVRKLVVHPVNSLALNRGATVTIVRHAPEAFAQHGPVAALLRY